jgi:hypothetical protein
MLLLIERRRMTCKRVKSVLHSTEPVLALICREEWDEEEEEEEVMECVNPE